MSDPISRLQFGRDGIDGAFSQGYAAANPDVVASVSSMDWCAIQLVAAIREAACVAPTHCNRAIIRRMISPQRDD